MVHCGQNSVLMSGYLPKYTEFQSWDLPCQYLCYLVATGAPDIEVGTPSAIYLNSSIFLATEGLADFQLCSFSLKHLLF